MSSAWYRSGLQGSLSQGELFFSVPVLLPDPGLLLGDDEGSEVELPVESRDVVVLTQTCDLENAKVESALVAVLRDYDEFARQEDARGNGYVRSKGFRVSVRKGTLPAYFVLPPHSGRPPFGWTIVDLHHLFTVPVSVLEALAKEVPRVGLSTPYREYLSQHVGAFFMRVALDETLHEFDTHQVS